MNTPTDVRHLYSLDPAWAYLNHGSYGACPLPVREVKQSFDDALERNPHDFFARQLPTLLGDVREQVVEYFGLDTEHADGLVLHQNVTSALATLTAAFPLAAGDEVLVSDAEYETVVLAWTRRARANGARVTVVPLPFPLTRDEDVVNAFEAARTPNTRVMVISHITSSTSVALPVARLAEWGRSNRIRVAVDGAHAPGQLPLELNALISAGVDAYAGDFHKWISAPRGSAFGWLSAELRPLVPPLVASWGMLEHSTFVGNHLRRETHDPTAMLAVPAALAFHNEHVGQASTALAARLTAEVDAVFDQISGASAYARREFRAPRMVSYELPYDVKDREELERTFREAQIEVQISERQDRLLMRVSLAPYVSSLDIDRWGSAFLEANRKLCAVLLPISEDQND